MAQGVFKDDLDRKVFWKYRSQSAHTYGIIHKYLSMEAVVAVVEKAAGIECPLQSTGTSRQIGMTALYY